MIVPASPMVTHTHTHTRIMNVTYAFATHEHARTHMRMQGLTYVARDETKNLGLMSAIKATTNKFAFLVEATWVRR